MRLNVLAEPRIRRALAVHGSRHDPMGSAISNSRHERGSSTFGVNRHGIDLNLGSSFQDLSVADVVGAFIILPEQSRNRS